MRVIFYDREYNETDRAPAHMVEPAGAYSSEAELARLGGFSCR